MEPPSLHEIAAGYRPWMLWVRWASGVAAVAGFCAVLPAARLLWSLPWAVVFAVAGAAGGALLARRTLIPWGSERRARYQMGTETPWLDHYYRDLQQFAARRGDTREAERMLWVLVAAGHDAAYRDLVALLKAREDCDGLRAARPQLLRAHQSDPAAAALRQDQAEQEALLPLLVDAVPGIHPWPLIHLADLHQQLGDERAAVTAWRRALQTAAGKTPGDRLSDLSTEQYYRGNLWYRDTLYSLIILLASQGRWSEAQAIALLEKRRGNPRARIPAAALRRLVE